MYNRQGEQEVIDVDNKLQKRQAEEEREKICRKTKEKQLRDKRPQRDMNMVGGRRKIKTDRTVASGNPVELNRRIISLLHPSSAAFYNG